MKVLTHERHLDCPAEIPDELLDERWAIGIHGQTLKRLNERGGLSPSEIYGNVKKLSFREICSLKDAECVKWLKSIVAQPAPTIPKKQDNGDLWDEATGNACEYADNKLGTLNGGVAHPVDWLIEYERHLKTHYSLTKK